MDVTPLPEIMKRQEAFTLIELIIAMSVILIFVGLAVVDFRGSKQSQETVQMVEETRALLQQSRARVHAGQTQEGAYVCEGVYFEMRSRPQQAVMPLREDGLCDVGSAVLSDYGMQQGNPEVSFVSSVIGGAYLLYMPPRADLQAYRGDGELLEEELMVRFSNQSGEDGFELKSRLRENHFEISSVQYEEE